MRKFTFSGKWLLIVGIAIFLLITGVFATDLGKTRTNTANAIADLFAPPLTQEEAVGVVKKLMNAKRQFYGPNFNREALAQITVGEELRKRSGTIQALKDNNAYYVYGNYEVIPRYFNKQGRKAVIEVELTENVALASRIAKAVPSLRSAKVIVRYNLEVDNGIWKVALTQELS